jgi:uncharacterized protein YndB with AHSA1/START domain
MTDTIDKEQKTVSFERILGASPAEVFDAWTQPEQISQWWDPTGAPLVACSIDLKPKGAFRFVTAGHAPPFEGVYEVVDRPNRLEFNAMGAKGTVTLRPHAQGTQMSVSIRSPSTEHFEMFRKLGVNVGTGKTLDNLVAFVRRRSQASTAR